MSRLRRELITIRGESFTVREWTPAERSEAMKQRNADMSLLSATVAYYCTLGETGERYFKSMDAVLAEPAGLIDELCAAAIRLSTEDDEKNA